MVTLRRTLLLAFLLLGLVPSIALSWLSFSRTRDAMSAQIAQSLAVQAQSLQSDIDSMLFERFENALVWGRSELMQDLRLGDVDKRVSNYLVGLAAGYGGVYQGMDCRRDDGLVLASTRPADIGRHTPDGPADGASRAVSFEARLSGGQVRLLLPVAPSLDDRLPIAIETDIASAYPLDRKIARLHLDLDAGQLSRLLDRAAVGRRVIVVLDAQGHWVAASQSLRGRALPDLAQRQAGLLLAGSAGPTAHRTTPWLNEPVILGLGRSRAGPVFGGSGWTTVVLQPVDEALAPVRDMAGIFGGLLLLVLLITLLAATLIAAAIARPILALTAVTRGYQRDGVLPASSTGLGSRISELKLLGQAYLDMMRTVDSSRQQLVRSAKLAMLGELAAVLAHEVRTPLGILRSSAQVLLRDRRLSEDSRELMGFIESETERLNRLVSTLLDTARPRLPSFAPVDMHALLRRCVQMQELQQALATPSSTSTSTSIAADAVAPAAPATPQLGVELLATDAMVEADAEQLMQAVFNLLNNAVQAVGAGGLVLISTADAGEQLRIDCADNGPGIPPAIAERIFDPFVTGRDGGIGLGLAVVQQVIAAHGGQISVGRSAAGGTLFSLFLPRRQTHTNQDTPC